MQYRFRRQNVTLYDPNKSYECHMLFYNFSLLMSSKSHLKVLLMQLIAQRKKNQIEL